ncbi:MAG: DUF3800 domain-containing protein [Chloroflexota bacterium]|nr:DUF3800 domain-containing protein [Chloroflexota bacterium]
MAAHIYIDESGSLADPRDTIMTLAAIKTQLPRTLRWIIRRVKRGVQHKKAKRPRPSEFKFYTTTDSARAMVLEALAQEKVEIFALSVFTGPQMIPHTPANYGIPLCNLLRMCGAEQEHVVELAIDVPFNTHQQRARLTTVVRNALDLNVEIGYVDSVENPYIQLVDFVVGAIRANQMGRDRVLYQFIQPRMISEQLVTWKTLKREWIEENWRG